MFKTLFREKLFSSYIWQLIFMNELFMLIKIKLMNKLVFIFLFLNLLIFSDNLFSQYYTNQYATLDGTDDYFSAPSHPELNLDSAFTIECWIFLKDTTGFNKTILSIANSANNSGYALLVKGANSNPGSAGRLQFNINGTNNIISQNTGTRISLNNWNHIALTFKRGGLNISDTLRFYINGNQVTSLTRLNESIVNSSDSLRIGSCYLPGNYSNSFSGYIDDLRIYKTRRAAVYISNDRGVPVSMEGITNSGLLSNSRYASLTAAWKFDGNGNDNTGFSNNLRLNNGTSFFNSSFNPLPYRNQSNYFIKFSGTSWLAAPDSSNSSYDADTACTIEAYVYPDSAVSAQQTLISKGNNYKIGISNNRYYFSINAGSKILKSFSNIKLKQWTHIAVTYRSLTGAMNIYLNGNLDSSKIFSNGNITVTNDSLFMGRSNSGEFLFGKLDEVRISRISKTQELIKKYLYTNIDNNNGNQFSPVVNCYGFEGNTLDNVTGVKPMLIRGDAYFEWINNNSTAGGSSQAPLIRRSLSDEGFPADRSLSGFSIRNNSTIRDSIYVTTSANSFLK
ncbi:MAG: LamG domain-containing protein, partial [Ignavibacteria bacterium]|nr:LamG domain-containing protein [Ignavibacteria bacterium]